MHLWVILSNFPPLQPRPHHKSVHGSLYVLLLYFLLRRGSVHCGNGAHGADGSHCRHVAHLEVAHRRTEASSIAHRASSTVGTNSSVKYGLNSEANKSVGCSPTLRNKL